MSLRRLTAVLAVCMVLTALPAQAAEPDYDLGIELLPDSGVTAPTYRVGRAVDTRDPWVAASLSLVGPSAMALAGASVFQMPSPSNIKVNGMPPYQFGGMVMVSASPLGLGLGQAYAGDPLRGFLVSLGGPATALGCGLAGMFLGIAMSPGSMFYAASAGLTTGATIGAVGYNIWAATDAFDTARRRNEAALRP